MSWNWLRSISLAVICLLWGQSATFAQSDTPNCYDLSPQDCALYYDAFDQGFETISTDYAVSLDLTLGRDSAALTLDGSASLGAYFDRFEELSEDEFGAALQAADIGAMANMVFTVFEFTSSTDFHWVEPGYNTLDTIEARLINSRLYFKSLLITSGVWMYVDIGEAMTEMMANAPDQTGAEILLPADDNSDMLADVLATPGVVTVQALNADPIDGQRMREFTFTVNAVEAIQSDAFRPIWEQSVRTAFAGEPMTDEDVALFTEMILVNTTPTLEDSVLTLTWLIGTQDTRVHRFAMHFEVHTEEGAGFGFNSTQDALDIVLDLALDFYAVDEPLEVVEPEPALDFLRYFNQ